jgi:hypothetical protein
MPVLAGIKHLLSQTIYSEADISGDGQIGPAEHLWSYPLCHISLTYKSVAAYTPPRQKQCLIKNLQQLAAMIISAYDRRPGVLLIDLETDSRIPDKWI